MAPICGLCGWRSVHLGLGKAPGNAQEHYRQWLSHPEQTGEIERALALNPRYTAAWISRGLAAEMAGNRALAESRLLRAAEIDRRYLPAWTLANFYLRGGDMAAFWEWARRASGMAYEPAALFQLFWRVSTDPREILEKGISRTPATRRAYFDFLLRADRLEAAAPLALDIGRTAAASDADLLLRYCDAALASGARDEAVAAWEMLAKAGLIYYAHPSALTNGDFAKTPLGRGFDWRPRQIAGVSTLFDPESREMSVALSGKQPETGDLAEQYLALEPGAVYRFRFRYRTHDLPTDNGLAWSFVNADTGAEFARIAIPKSAAESNERESSFSAPKGNGLARILLRYRRPAGSVRAEGLADFQSLSLEVLR